MKQGDSFLHGTPFREIKIHTAKCHIPLGDTKDQFPVKNPYNNGWDAVVSLSAKRKDVEALYGSNFLVLLTGNKDYFTTQVKYFCYNLTPLPYIGTV